MGPGHSELGGPGRGYQLVLDGHNWTEGSTPAGDRGNDLDDLGCENWADGTAAATQTATAALGGDGRGGGDATSWTRGTATAQNRAETHRDQPSRGTVVLQGGAVLVALHITTVLGAVMVIFDGSSLKHFECGLKKLHSHRLELCQESTDRHTMN